VPFSYLCLSATLQHETTRTLLPRPSTRKRPPTRSRAPSIWTWPRSSPRRRCGCGLLEGHHASSCLLHLQRAAGAPTSNRAAKPRPAFPPPRARPLRPPVWTSWGRPCPRPTASSERGGLPQPFEARPPAAAFRAARQPPAVRASPASSASTRRAAHHTITLRHATLLLSLVPPLGALSSSLLGTSSWLS
jgi:hypothetical protein